MEGLTEVKLRNGQRLAKKDRKREEREYNNITPKKYFDKDSTHNTYCRLEKKMGYNYNTDSNRTMRWMKEEFTDKLVKYIANRGSGEYAQKMSRMDKVKLKESLGFKLKVNPLIRVFSKVNSKLEKGMLWEGFQALQV